MWENKSQWSLKIQLFSQTLYVSTWTPSMSKPTSVFWICWVKLVLLIFSRAHLSKKKKTRRKLRRRSSRIKRRKLRWQTCSNLTMKMIKSLKQLQTKVTTERKRVIRTMIQNLQRKMSSLKRLAKMRTKINLKSRKKMSKMRMAKVWNSRSKKMAKIWV